MVDRAVALEALGASCNANITSSVGGSVFGGLWSLLGISQQGSPSQLGITNFIPTVLDGEQTCSVSRYKLSRFRGSVSAENPSMLIFDSSSTSRTFNINEEEFFDPSFDYDFRNKTDAETYYRGGEEYGRPSGWSRFALKVLDKYEDNTWLGNQSRTTKSVPGEWPVSYHGTSDMGASGIIKGNYKAGPRQLYGRGVYSTPDLSVAENYATQFKSKTDGKTYKVVLQNRINPKYREKHKRGKYWLIPIPAGTTPRDEDQMVERAIRPYGLLLKEVESTEDESTEDESTEDESTEDESTEDESTEDESTDVETTESSSCVIM